MSKGWVLWWAIFTQWDLRPNSLSRVHSVSLLLLIKATIRHFLQVAAIHGIIRSLALTLFPQSLSLDIRIAHSILALSIMSIFLCPWAESRAEDELMPLILKDFLWWNKSLLALRRRIYHAFESFRLQSSRKCTLLIHHEAFVLGQLPFISLWYALTCFKNLWHSLSSDFVAYYLRCISVWDKKWVLLAFDNRRQVSWVILSETVLIGFKGLLINHCLMIFWTENHTVRLWLDIFRLFRWIMILTIYVSSRVCRRCDEIIFVLIFWLCFLEF